MDSTSENQGIYRENAIKHLNNIRESNELFLEAGTGYHLWILAGIIVTLLAFLWLTFGKITLIFSANGILMPVECKAIPVIALQSGFITQIFSKKGDIVKPGEKLAHIEDPVFNTSLNQALQEKKYHEQMLQDAVNQYEKRRHVLDQQLTIDKVNLTKNIINHENQCQILLSLYRKKASLLSKKYITIVEVARSKADYLSEVELLQKLNIELTMLEKNYIMKLTPYRENIQKCHLEYRKSNDAYEYKLLKSKAFDLISPAAGTVLEQHVVVGEYIVSGNPVISLLLSDKLNEYEVLAFVNQSVKQALAIHSKVTIYLDTAGNQNTLNGVIKTISEYPISKAALYSHLGNTELVNQFFINGPPYLVTIRLSDSNMGAPGMVVKIKIHSYSCTPLQRMRHQCGSAHE